MAGDCITVEGVVTSTHQGDLHHVEVTISGQKRDVIARRCGRLNQHRIRLLPGDRVTVELSPYDLTRGRVTHRF